MCKNNIQLSPFQATRLLWSSVDVTPLPAEKKGFAEDRSKAETSDANTLCCNAATDVTYASACSCYVLSEN